MHRAGDRTEVIYFDKAWFPTESTRSFMNTIGKDVKNAAWYIERGE